MTDDAPDAAWSLDDFEGRVVRAMTRARMTQADRRRVVDALRATSPRSQLGSPLGRALSNRALFERSYFAGRVTLDAGAFDDLLDAALRLRRAAP